MKIWLPYENSSFGSRLKSVIKKRGFTQMEFAEKLDISQSTLTKYISGENKPSLEKYIEICNVLEVPSDWLLLGKPFLPEHSSVYFLLRRLGYDVESDPEDDERVCIKYDDKYIEFTYSEIVEKVTDIFDYYLFRKSKE